MYDYPNPVFLDFETQSKADIKETGGRLYAYHPSTRILITVIAADNVFYVWIPDHIKTVTPFAASTLWPSELKPTKEVRLFRGATLPSPIVELINAKVADGSPLIAHNAFGFDKHIWDRFIKIPVQWADSLYVARSAGLPGSLESLGKRLIGVGKDRAKKLLPILTTVKPSIWGGYDYPKIKPGDLQAFTRYAVADVEILRRMWDMFGDVEVETDVIDTHNIINQRGIEVDKSLLRTIERISLHSTTTAANRIAILTKGQIPADKLRSTKVMHEWLESYGVSLVDEGRLDEHGKPKKSLRKDVVQKLLDSPYVIEDNLIAAREIPPIVCDVLRLRLKALRITDAKAKRAQSRVDADGRIRDLISYHTAHTGRFSSSGVQVHNLPSKSPFKSKHVQEFITLFDSINTIRDDAELYNRTITQLESMRERDKDNPKLRIDEQATIDDVCSAMIRPCFKPKKGHTFIIADYSAIEARGIAGIAGEEKLLNVFRRHGEVYKEFAAKCYGKPVEQVTSDERNGVGKIGILGLGYGMGTHKFRVFAANAGVDLVKAGITAELVVDTYRDTFTAIAGWKPRTEYNKTANYRVGGVWKDLHQAVSDCVTNRELTSAGRSTFHMVGTTLYCTLPSGRVIRYPNARIEDIIPPYVYTMGLPLVPKATVVYESPHGPKSLFGGLIAENIVQAISRDILAIALVKLERAGFCPILHVHDEIVCEVPIAKADSMIRQMIRIMVEPLDWCAEWFPIAAEGFICPRFNKKPFPGFEEVSSKSL